MECQREDWVDKVKNTCPGEQAPLLVQNASSLKVYWTLFEESCLDPCFLHLSLKLYMNSQSGGHLPSSSNEQVIAYFVPHVTLPYSEAE
jgi:hypothetical protein